MHSLIEGMALGLTLDLFFGFGPAFFAEVQTGIHRGFYKGFILALGVFLNDLVLVGLSIIGAHVIMNTMHKYQILGVIGGIILILFGIFTYRDKIEITGEDEDININEPHVLMYMLKGFLLNIANPFVWLFWPTVVLGVATPFMNTTMDIIFFFSGTLSMFLLVDTTKVFLASRIKNYITDKVLHLINKVAGVGLFIFGIVLVIRTLVMAGIF
ncbi:MAG: LysE family transporter [Bacteroidales bacterium]|nr:LysE family transporter [Bacteroidales bacterium]